MADKPIAFAVVALLAAPACALCVLGPAAVGGFLMGLLGWLTATHVVALLIVAALLVIAYIGFRDKRSRTQDELRPRGFG